MGRGRKHRTLRGLAVVASSSFLALAAVGTASAHPLVADTRDDDVAAGDNLAALICSYDVCDDSDELAARIDQLLGGFSLIDESTDPSTDVADPEGANETDGADTEDHSSDSTDKGSTGDDRADNEPEQHDSADAEDDSSDNEDHAGSDTERHDSGDAEDDSSDNEDHAGSDTESHDSGDTEDGGDSHDD